ncbi:MAG: lipopolysaccharide biosynthesis protein [Agriterribacter sp.]
MSNQVQQTKKGIKWSLADQVLRQIITLIISGILSRLVTPSEYGVLGMVTVATGFFQVFKDVGLGSSIIQKQGVTEDEKSTIFWLNVSIGIVLAIILISISPLIAVFFEQPQLKKLVAVMGLNFVITSLLIVPDALIQKSMNFKGYFVLNFIATVLSGVVGIGLAFNGAGVWALLAQIICSSFVTLILSFKVAKWVPTIVFNKSLLKDHLKFSGPVLADNSINYWVRNLDKILTGKMLGPVSLGVYTRAYTLMLLPLNQISNTLNRVMFPSFSLIHTDKEKIWDQFSKMLAIIAFVCFPLMSILGVFAKEVILFVYGTSWSAVIPIFKVLCILGASQALASTFGSIYYATAQTKLMFKVGVMSRTFMLAGIILGIYTGGLTGMIWGYLISSIAAMSIEIHYVCKILNKNSLCFFKNIFPETIGAILVIFFFIIIKRVISDSDIFTLKNIILNFLIICIGVLIYIFILIRLKSIGFKVFKSNINAQK